MAKGSRIKATRPKVKGRKIKETKIYPEPTVSFNFKCLSKKNKKFDYMPCQAQYFQKLLERLKALSCLTRKELTYTLPGKALRCHRIEFGDPNVSEGTFGLGDDIDEDAWQFQISKMNGRIHGYFVESVFYIVWLDPKHKLYPGH